VLESFVNIVLCKAVCGIPFTVSCCHFQLTTTCSQLISCFLEARLQYAPVLARIRTIGNSPNDINNRESPCGFFFIPHCPDLVVFIESYRFIAHNFYMTRYSPLSYFLYEYYAKSCNFYTFLMKMGFSKMADFSAKRHLF